MRLDQFIQLSCHVSRREAREILKSKHIFVNGLVVQRAGHILSLEKDRIYYKESELTYDSAFHYLLLHKPSNYVCSHQDDGYLSIFRLIHQKYAYDLHIAGRLDADTTGLVILTDDGDFSHRLTHPAKACVKKYRVKTLLPMTQEMIQQLMEGVQLHGERELTAPATVVWLDHCLIELHITEGRYHQVKRMLAAVGNRVIGLHRFQVGNIDLTGLNEGEYRMITELEYKVLNEY